MNFLAHLHLSGNHVDLTIGNFIADFVKGKNALAAFAPGITRGIKLHRAIDLFTDEHPVVAQSKNRLRPKYRHYAGVIVDVFYDHFLARYWHLYHEQPLELFAAQTYATLEKHFDILPERVQHMLPYMMRGNWLVNYARIEGISGALTGMAKRTPFDSRMDEAVHELRLFEDAFREEFTAFFPQLEQHVQEFLKHH